LLLLLASFNLAGIDHAHAANTPQPPETVQAMGRTLQLNGAGLRTATILKIKVYEAGLYLTHKSNDPQQILNSRDPKVVRMAFLHDVSTSQARDAWKDSFDKNCAPNCDALRPSFNQFLSKVSAAKTGDVLVFVFTPQGFNILKNGNETDRIANPLLGKTILSTWLGKEPPSTDLKQAMLGLNDKDDLS
jgi:hypothetical protein